MIHDMLVIIADEKSMYANNPVYFRKVIGQYTHAYTLVMIFAANGGIKSLQMAKDAKRLTKLPPLPKGKSVSGLSADEVEAEIERNKFNREGDGRPVRSIGVIADFETRYHMDLVAKLKNMDGIELVLRGGRPEAVPAFRNKPSAFVRTGDLSKKTYVDNNPSDDSIYNYNNAWNPTPKPTTQPRNRPATPGWHNKPFSWPNFQYANVAAVCILLVFMLIIIIVSYNGQQGQAHIDQQMISTTPIAAVIKNLIPTPAPTPSPSPELTATGIPDGWLEYGSNWSYFKDGKAVTGWQEIIKDNKTEFYCFDEIGNMIKGWVSYGDGFFYCLPDGTMAVEWQRIGANGSYKSGDDQKWYYFAPDTGRMLTGWLQLDDNWYFLDSNGAMVTGTNQVVNGQTYSFDENGRFLY